eukprot:gnl/MRDRNA2_/MRDRNA2_93343_c0_seq1.p1 gnl/MRDRNA2_/MRDRNA2_93343_c0~~gnl/MRDRNA2_/MRDRNA2_93343_c0_seq1.p1  ORF type:complete len:254 (+),score=56.08 gnl/MRDRNA2_/MRDRNA2_93343_c0_seq1:100-861(+)
MLVLPKDAGSKDVHSESISVVQCMSQVEIAKSAANVEIARSLERVEATRAARDVEIARIKAGTAIEMGNISAEMARIKANRDNTLKTVAEEQKTRRSELWARVTEVSVGEQNETARLEVSERERTARDKVAAQMRVETTRIEMQRSTGAQAAWAVVMVGAALWSGGSRMGPKFFWRRTLRWLVILTAGMAFWGRKRCLWFLWTFARPGAALVWKMISTTVLQRLQSVSQERKEDSDQAQLADAKQKPRHDNVM